MASQAPLPLQQTLASEMTLFELDESLSILMESATDEAANNNGSAFAGLNANTPFYNVGAGIVIWIGRFIPIISALAIVGRLASKKTVEASSGTLPTHGWTFGLTLTGVIVIVAALTFFPALCLGPIVEHGLMLAGRAF